jgi:hypothetical protein
MFIRSMAIRKYCRECAGGSSTEVTFCHLLDCPLWPYRTGLSIRTREYKKRIKGAFSAPGPLFKEIVGELAELGFGLDDFLGKPLKKKTPQQVEQDVD